MNLDDQIASMRASMEQREQERRAADLEFNRRMRRNMRLTTVGVAVWIVGLAIWILKMLGAL